MATSCIGVVLGEYGFLPFQQDAILELLSRTGQVDLPHTASCDYDNLFETHDLLIAITQEQFFARRDKNKDQDPTECVQDNQDKIREILQGLHSLCDKEGMWLPSHDEEVKKRAEELAKIAEDNAKECLKDKTLEAGLCTKNSLDETQKCIETIKEPQEREDARVPLWIRRSDPDRIIAISTEILGLDKLILPKRASYECAAVYGSYGPEMHGRISFLGDLLFNEIISVDRIYLLVGQRYVAEQHADRDGGIEYLTDLSNKLNVSVSKITETDLGIDTYNKIAQTNAILRDITMETVDTPRGIKNRPNTKDTVEKFLEQIDQNTCKSIVFVSRAPNIIPQGAATDEVMRKKSPERYIEVIGDAIRYTDESNYKIAHKFLMPLAGTLFEKYSDIQRQLSRYVGRLAKSYEELERYKLSGEFQMILENSRKNNKGKVKMF